MRVSLVHLAHARSGDKGDTANVGVIAYREEDYDLLREAVTAEAVKASWIRTFAKRKSAWR